MNYRREIVRLRETEKLTERAIARRLELRPTTVHYWLRKEILPPVTLKRGRPRVTDATLDDAIYRQSQESPFRTAVAIRDEVAPGISVYTVRNRLKERGLRCRVPSRKPFLKEEHIYKRLDFAYKHFNWGTEDWENIVFSDEKIFRASSGGPLRVYRPRKSNRFDPRYIAPSSNPTGRFTICVWMAFGKDFRAMRLVEQRTLESTYYTEVILSSIKDHLLQNDLIFMQDLSSIHTSRLSAHWFECHNVDVMSDWPPKGPDMNPVENVWAELVRRTRNDSTNKNQLWENVYAAFLALEEAYFNKLLESMPRRMARVIAAKGGWTKY